MRRICKYKKMLSLTSDQEKEELNVALVVKNPPGNAGDLKTEGLIWVRKIPWRRAWQPTPVFLPGESHGQRSLVGHGP